MEQEYDPSNTDAIRNHYVIRVRGFISTSAGTFPTGTTGSMLAAIKARLESPRRPFLYTIDGSAVVSIPSGLDAKLGPKPLPARVTEVNSGLFAVECGVECWTVDCDNDCLERSPVLSLRWTQSESFDQNWYSKLKTNGLLIVRSDLLQCADNFRALATPGILPDYQRISSSYTLSHDGLELEFEFDDQEVDRLPPYPATKANGTYTVVVTRPGTIRHGTVVLTLEGPKGSSRRDLMVRAINMAYSKLQSDNISNPRAPIWSGQFDEDLYIPKVKVSITAMMTPLTGTHFLTAFGGAAVMPSVGRVQEKAWEDGLPGIAPPERKRLARLLTAAFRDPCACLTATRGLTSTGSPASPPPNFSIVDLVIKGVTTATSEASIVRGVISSAASSISQAIQDFAPYDTYILEAATSIITGAVHLPGTGTGPTGGISKVVSASGQKMQLTISWVAGRTGKPPQLPTFYPTDSNLVALSGDVVANDVHPSPDGADLVYLLAGYYTYAVLDPSKFRIVPGVAPFYGPPVQQGAELAAGFWTDSPIWDQLQQTAGNTNALIVGGVSPGTQPQTPPGYDSTVIAAASQIGSQLGRTGDPQQGSFYFPPIGP